MERKYIMALEDIKRDIPNPYSEIKEVEFQMKLETLKIPILKNLLLGHSVKEIEKITGKNYRGIYREIKSLKVSLSW